MLGGTLVALTLAEVSVRALDPQPAPAGLLRGMLTEPGDHPVRSEEYDVTVHVNARGFVDDEWVDRAGVPRVVVIGDSFVQAAQVDPGLGYGARLETRLYAEGLEADVRSLGVPGAGTATALGILEEYALPMKPDLVILGFLVSNDVLNNHPLLEGKDDKPFYALRDGQLAPVKAADLVGGPLWQWSALWRRVTRDLMKRRIAERKLSLGQGMPLDLRVYDPACGGACAVWDEAWAVTDALLGEMDRACGEIPFAIVLFPDRNQVLGRSEWGTGGWDFSAAQARAASVAAKHGAVLDLLPDIRGEDGLYLPKDGHWTARGHDRAAELTVPLVRELLGRP